MWIIYFQTIWTSFFVLHSKSNFSFWMKTNWKLNCQDSPDFHWPAKFGHGIWSLPFTVSWLLSSKSIYQILPTTVWARHLTLSKSKYWSWGRSFANKDVNEKVMLFHKTIVNKLLNYILHVSIFWGDRDPWWMKNNFKKCNS